MPISNYYTALVGVEIKIDKNSRNKPILCLR